MKYILTVVIMFTGSAFGSPEVHTQRAEVACMNENTGRVTWRRGRCFSYEIAIGAH